MVLTVVDARRLDAVPVDAVRAGRHGAGRGERLAQLALLTSVTVKYDVGEALHAAVVDDDGRQTCTVDTEPRRRPGPVLTWYRGYPSVTSPHAQRLHIGNAGPLFLPSTAGLRHVAPVITLQPPSAAQRRNPLEDPP